VGTPQESDGPAPGDVVITTDDRRPGVYAVAQIPAAPQICWRSRDVAVRTALRFAQRHAVDAWIRENSLLTHLGEPMRTVRAHLAPASRTLPERLAISSGETVADPVARRLTTRSTLV
jgi:hypothetical protein